MKITVKGTAKLRPLSGGEVVDVLPEDLDWDVVSTEEREMGTAVHYEATYDLGPRGSVTWTLVEYPTGAENFRRTHWDRVEVLQDFDYYLEHTPDD
ncbi:hypothetical protein [Chelativorans sp. J32]|uniref:hypothetical protein n=1 Tax=Chelativorans sp. J32 TaxID=935840 RepID=UPI000481652B|nr:hypothetical protein [Chelativorans sp. J32]